ncbi:PAS domain S-box protein [Dongia sp.]|uniref:PAS domain-containing hybrid sensor histidine kinase/response regulator n=1 Tax=Dongia sp. TaxID=1977262 RepID=UPI0035AF46DF
MDNLQIPTASAPVPTSIEPDDDNLGRALFDALPIAVCTVDASGIVRATNRAWERLAEGGGGRVSFHVGDDCFLSLDRSAAKGDTMAGEIAAGLRAVIDGTVEEFLRKDARCLSHPDNWFDISVKALGGHPRRFLLTLDDVSGRRHALNAIVESEARHRHAERIARLGHWRLVHRDGDWKNGTIDYSEEATAILGLPPGGTTHSFDDMRRLIHPDDLAKVLAAYEAEDSDTYVVEYRVVRADGTVVTVQEAGESVPAPEHGLAFEFGTIQDVTVQRQDADRLRRLNDELEQLAAERTAALAERESQLSRAQALARMGHYTWRKEQERRTDGGWHTGLTYSPAIAAIFGVTLEELIVPDEAYVERFVHPDDRAHVNQAYFTHFREQASHQLPIEYRIVRPDGSVRYVVEIIERLVGDEDNVTGALGTIQDITERKEVELALRESEARLQAFMDNAPFIMSIKDVEGRMQMINREGADSYETTESELCGRLTEELMPDESGRAITAMSRAVIATGGVVSCELELPGRKRYRWSLEIEFPIRGANGDIAAIGGFAVDITERKRTELALRESEARLRAIFDHVPVTLSLSDLDGRYTMVNLRFLEKVGKTEAEVIGHGAVDLFGPGPGGHLNERKAYVMRTLEPLTYEARTPTELGARDCAFTHFPIMDGGALTAVGTISLDLTEQRAAEAALHQAQKMELVGQLTGGLAHDFNNLLGAIVGNLDLLALETEGRPRARELLDRAISATERGAALIQRLLAFSRRQALSPRRIDINRHIQDMRPLLEDSLGGGTHISIRTSADMPCCSVDPTQLEAALLNLAINARDAMPDGGRLIIETANVTMTPDAAASPLPQPYVMIVVSDEGTGMSRDILDHVFEPFFTTKPVGKGTGLGLSTVHGFVKQSGGHVRIDSQLGRGTTVGLFLPCIAERTERAAMAPARHRAVRPRGRDGKILLVAGDGAYLAACASALRQSGFDCLTAATAAEALAALDRNRDVALIFSELLVPGDPGGPGRSGLELVGRARRARPNLKALYTSRPGDAAQGGTADLPAGNLLLPWPYSFGDLAELLADLLAEPDP